MKEVAIEITNCLRLDPRRLDVSTLTTITKEFTEKNPQYARLRSMGYAAVKEPPQYRLFEFKGDGELLLYRGLGIRLREILTEKGYKVGWLDRRVKIPGRITMGSLRPRENQAPAIDTLLKRQQGIIRGPTGVGKTEVLLAAAAKAGQKTLIVVWNKELQTQWIDRIKKYGMTDSLGTIGGGKAMRLADVTVAMNQSLVRGDIMQRLRAHFGTIILEECQRTPASTFVQVANALPAVYRWGCSADERRTDKKEFLAYSTIGGDWDKAKERWNPIYEIEAQESVLDPRILIIPTEYEDFAYEGDRNFVSMINRLVKHEGRNNLIEQYVFKELQRGKQVLLFTERVEAALHWVDRVKFRGFTAGPLVGGTELRDETSATLLGLRTKTIQFAATTTFGDVGLDIPSLEVGMITCPTAGNPKRMVQQVGRIIRPHSEKSEALIYYFWDRAVMGLSYRVANIKRRWKKWEVLEARA